MLPRVTAAPFSVLTVCIGNICRSPLAERLLRLRLAEAVEQGLVSVESAGVGAVVGRPVDDLALAELERLGGSGEGFVARQVTTALLKSADLVLTATVGVRARALQVDPSALKRTFTLAELAAICGAGDDPSVATARDLVAYAATHRALAAGVDLDVVDPVGLGPAEHRAVADQIDGHVTVIAATLGRLLPDAGHP